MGDPGLSRFFENADLKRLRGKQKAFLTKAFGGPDRFEGRDLTAAHAKLVRNGLDDTHFDAVVGHLQATLSELGVAEDITNEVMTIAASTREAVLGRGRAQPEPTNQEDTMELKREVTEGSAGLAKSGATEYQQMLENMPINVMMADPKTFDITYINRTSVETLKTLEHLLPVKADQMLGQSIDIFHKDPAHQRRLLSDPKNLPHKANIKVGDEILDLLVTAIKDKEGNYIGPMLSWSVITQKVASDKENSNLVATLSGIGASQAMIEFEMDGTIITANENFLGALGYTLDEVQGKHHRILADAVYRESNEYGQFWDELRKGKFQAGQFKRIHKNGDDVWIQAAYNPVLGPDGKPYKVVKNAVNVTEARQAQLTLAENISNVSK